jgi:hypothetical protein
MLRSYSKVDFYTPLHRVSNVLKPLLHAIPQKFNRTSRVVVSATETKYHPRFHITGLKLAYKHNLSFLLSESTRFFADTADVYFAYRKKVTRIPKNLTEVQKGVFRIILAVFCYHTRLIAIAKRKSTAGVFADRFSDEYLSLV